MGFAREVAHHILFMNDGSIIEDTPKEIFFTNPKSERAKEFLAKNYSLNKTGLFVFIAITIIIAVFNNTIENNAFNVNIILFKTV